MAFKTNIAPNTRTFIVSPNGNDSQDGQGPETALLTIATAIARINALVPPPGSDAADFSLIQIVGAGQFTESDLVFPTGCQVMTAFTVMRIGGAITLLALGGMIFFLVRRERQRRMTLATT